MSSSAPAPINQQEIVGDFNRMRQELAMLAQKIGELEQEKEEFQLVVDTLSPLDANRKCFRLVSGVLVERTIKEVLPAVKTNMEGIQTVMVQMAKTYKKKEDDMAAFQKKYNIVVKAQ